MTKLPSIYGSNQSQGVTGVRLGSTTATLQTGEVTVTPGNIGAQVAGSYAAASHGTHVSASTCVTSINGSKGDVTLTIPQGTVKSVNGVSPDSNGNVTLSFFGMPNYNAKIVVGSVPSYTATAPGIVFFRLGKPGSAGSTTNASINGTVLFAVAYNDTNTRRYWAILDTDDVLKNESNGNLLDVNFFPFK